MLCVAQADWDLDCPISGSRWRGNARSIDSCSSIIPICNVRSCTRHKGRGPEEAEQRPRPNLRPSIELSMSSSTTRFFRSENAMEIAENYDIIIDGTDNFPTRYLSNDVSVLLKKPEYLWLHLSFRRSVHRLRSDPRWSVLSLSLSRTPPPGMVPSCAEGGVLGVLPGVVGVIQAIRSP